MTTNYLNGRSKKAITSAVVFMLLLAFGAGLPSLVNARPTAYTDVTVDRAYRMIKRTSPSRLVILDVRNQSEYDVGHLYGAILIPLGQLENRTRASPMPQPPANNSLMMSLYERVNSAFQLQAHINDQIIVYCKAGSRSAQACQILVGQGFTRVYNMLGGITAWMQVDYPIYTSYHHVTVDVTHNCKKTLIDIEPWLLYKANCTSCESQSQPCSVIDTPANATETVLEESENHTVLLITGEVNGTAYDYTIDKTLLWHYNDSMNAFNRTITFASTVIRTEDNSTHLFVLSDYVQHEDYTMAVNTILYPLDSETYKQSLTDVEYMPTGEKRITTAERVDFNTSVTLSQLYASLSKVINKLGNIYERSEDASLRVFAERYSTMADETKLLSVLLKTHILEYNKDILSSTAAVMDLNWCSVCSIVCGIAVLLGCGGIIVFTEGAAFAFCATYTWKIGAYGCAFLCILICSGSSETSPFWVSSVEWYGWDGTGYVGNPDNIAGSSNDDEFATLYAGNYGDTGRIIGNMNSEATGHIYIYGYSAEGYYSHLYVYVSDDYENWDYVSDQTVTANSPYSIDCGTPQNSFTYIYILVYDSGLSACLYIDAVSVVP